MAPVLVEEEDDDDESESGVGVAVVVAVDAGVDEIVTLVLDGVAELISDANVYESFALNESYESAHPT